MNGGAARAERGRPRSPDVWRQRRQGGRSDEAEASKDAARVGAATVVECCDDTAVMGPKPKDVAQTQQQTGCDQSVIRGWYSAAAASVW